MVIAFTRQGYRRSYVTMASTGMRAESYSGPDRGRVHFPASKNLEVFSFITDALISPEKWTAPLAQTLGEMKIVNIKPLRWPRCVRAGCTYCLKSLIDRILVSVVLVHQYLFKQASTMRLLIVRSFSWGVVQQSQRLPNFDESGLWIGQFAL